MNGEPLLSADQLVQLRRPLDAGSEGLRLSNRNVANRISHGTSGALAEHGLVDVVDTRTGRVVFITDAGRAALDHNATHVPPKISETDPYRRGVARAQVDRATGIAQVQAVLDAELAKPSRDQYPALINSSRATLDRLRAAERADQEEPTT